MPAGAGSFDGERVGAGHDPVECRVIVKDVFDQAAAISPEAGVALYSLGDQALLDRLAAVLDQGLEVLDAARSDLLEALDGDLRPVLARDLIKRFVVDEGVGQDQRFWRLSQALAALYPPGSHERRWAEGVLARKKTLGF